MKRIGQSPSPALQQAAGLHYFNIVLRAWNLLYGVPGLRMHGPVDLKQKGTDLWSGLFQWATIRLQRCLDVVSGSTLGAFQDYVTLCLPGRVSA